MAKDDRLRVSVDEPYLSSLGLALFVFARLEWEAVYLVEIIYGRKHNPASITGYVGSVGAKTAGQIANDLTQAVAGMSDAKLKAAVEPHAVEFARLVRRRNDLMHANPATAPNGDQRLFRHGSQWTIPEVDDLADEFSACQIEMNDLHHKVL